MLKIDSNRLIFEKYLIDNLQYYLCKTISLFNINKIFIKSLYYYVIIKYGKLTGKFRFIVLKSSKNLIVFYMEIYYEIYSTYTRIRQ